MKKVSTALPVQFKSNILFKNIFIKKGNGERSLSFLITLYTLLKLVNKRRILIVAGMRRKPPVFLLDRLLHQLEPAFIIRRVMAAGKPYMLPVPISEHRASYLACKWLRNAVLADTKGPTTIPHLMLKEILNLQKKKGLALQALSDYIKLAIDQRPFSRFLRRKFKNKKKLLTRVRLSKQSKFWRRKRIKRRLRSFRTKRNNRSYSALKKRTRILKSLKKKRRKNRYMKMNSQSKARK